MADYDPLLEKAVSALKPSTRQTRRAIYERARKALFANLRSIQPPLPESAIETEARALEAAIDRLERKLFYFPPTAEAAPAGQTATATTRATAAPAGRGGLGAIARQISSALASAAAFRERRLKGGRLRKDLSALGFEPDSGKD